MMTNCQLYTWRTRSLADDLGYFTTRPVKASLLYHFEKHSVDAFLFKKDESNGANNRKSHVRGPETLNMRTYNIFFRHLPSEQPDNAGPPVSKNSSNGQRYALAANVTQQTRCQSQHKG